MTPRLSIGLPVYNGERHLPAALASLLEQDFADFELIVSDNASSDRTPAMLEAFAASDARVRIERQPRNLGAAANYNRTLELARAPLFKWAAHDDVLRPGYLAACVDAMDADPGLVLCHARSEAIDDRGRRIGDYDREPEAMQAAPWRRFATLMLVPHYCIPVFGVIRREVLLRTARHGDWVGADRNLLAELALHGRIRVLPGILFQRRHHAGSSISALPDERARAAWFRADGRAVARPTWRRLLEYHRAVGRSPLGPGARLACRAQLLRWLAGRHHEGKRNAAKLLGEISSR